MARARRLFGAAALALYLLMGALTYLSVMPGADWQFPPDFRLLGYDAVSIAPFMEALKGVARDHYLQILSVWDRAFIVALAGWLALTGWRGGGLRWAVAGLALLYTGIDLAENAALIRVVTGGADPGLVQAAHSLTMAKFASLYLTALVLIVHLRRARG